MKPRPLLVVLALLAAASGRAAADSGRRTDLVATELGVVRFHLPAGTGAVVVAEATAPARIDVFADPAGTPVTGGDDSVAIGAAADARELVAVVRPAAPGADGSGTLRITVEGAAPIEAAIAFAGAIHSLPSGLASGARVTTVEQDGGATGTVLLVVNGATAVAFADDGGLDAMSRLETAAPCPAPCAVVVGRPAGAPDGAVTLVWDEDIAAGRDADGDGLGDALEAALGTAAGAPDSDQDGASDGVEVLGLDVAEAEPVKLPRYGADPLQPDVFVQADWQACDPAAEYCGPGNALDQHRMTAAGVAKLAAYFAPDVALHVDRGNWGGARRQPVGSHPCGPAQLGARYGLFHRGVVGALGGGGGGVLYGFCFGGDGTRVAVLAQELGHNFGLDHGGMPDAGPANCKPHYMSPMNYGYTYDPAVVEFSRGRFAGVPLDPTALDEVAGLGTTDPNVLARLAASPWELAVRADGAIDWNRDGRFESGVRGAPTWGWASCEQSAIRHDRTVAGLHPTLAWVTPAGQPARLYLVQRHPDEGWLEARFTPVADDCDLDGPVAPCTRWSPAATDRPRIVEGSARGTGAPALERYVAGDGTERLLVVYPDAGGALVWQQLLVDGSGERWTPAAPVEPGDAPAGDPAVARLGDRLLVFAPRDGELWAWDFFPESEAFSAGRAVAWTDGAPIAAAQGVGLARGALRGRAEQLFAAIPVGPFGTVEFAAWDDAAGAWERLPDTIWPIWRPMAAARPGLAFVPFGGGAPDEGRFYLAWKPYPAGAVMLSMSQGNDLAPDAPDRRLRFLRGTFLMNMWGIIAGSVTLLYDPAHDANLRATWGFSEASHVWFHPFADGIVDMTLRDQDDYGFILERLACSLTSSCVI